ncbi:MULTISPECIES: divergent polysaccharide deacetylase family protein [unclassified Yoonia]|uniref:divergent polysaccharide deacetylase family protein n=1 Tax=unclassified Yoonia TaxID=2629118 RepID=UPI002AFF4FFF|nr:MULTISPECIES: divergent polysaccharide deacetylase family protein [unclassified Yoonia]
MRAFLAGGFWAILIGGGALVTTSVLVDQPERRQPSDMPPPELAEVQPTAPVEALSEAVAPEPVVAPDPVEADPVAPVQPEPEPEAEPTPAPEAPALAETVPISEDAEAEAAEPAAVAANSAPPQATILAEALAAPDVIFDLPSAVATDAPVSPRQAAQAPAMPAQEPDVLIETRPAPAPAAPVELAEVPVDQPAPAQEPEPMPMLQPESAPAPELPQITDDIILPQPEVDTMPAPAQETTTALPQSAPSVRVNRPGTTPEAAEDAPDATPETDDLSPLVRYAADFDYAADLPMIAVVLLDNAMIIDAPAVLSGLPFVPTIVLNASAPDVTARMRAYRDAGIEVLLQADLPQGAQPADLETTYIAAFGLVPEAIAIFSDGTGPEVTDRVLADQALRLVGDEGRGFVTLPRGLGGAFRNVAANGVPIANIARELDGAGESRDAIERGLQQAALRARQSGNVILLGRATPDTLAAIRNWAARSDPAQISLAPVSAILQAQMPE